MSLLGKLASGLISSATHGAIRPHFGSNKTLRPSPARLPFGVGAGFGFGTGGDDNLLTDPAFDPNQQPNKNRVVIGKLSPDNTMPWKGYHWNKTGYFTRGGGTSPYAQKTVWHPPHSIMVRNRRRHVGNTRALRHAFTRVKGFAHLAHATITFVKRHKLKTHHRG